MKALVLIQVWDRNGNPIGGGTADQETRHTSDSARGMLQKSLRPAQRHVLESGAFTESSTLGGRAIEVSWLPLRGPSDELVGLASLVFDIEGARRTQLELSKRLEFESLITGLSTHFIDLGAHDIDRGINHALQAIGEFCDVDRAYLFRFSHDGTAMNNTHEWCASGIEPQIESLQGLPLDVFPWWIDHIRRHQVIHVPRVLDMPEEAATEKQILLEQQIRSLVVVPTLYQRNVVGFLGFDSVRAEKIWPNEDIALLKIVGEMLVSALQRKHSEEERRSLEAQLVQARSLENVAKLAGGVAHDFNNILSVILNFGAILQREVTDPDLQESVAELMRSAKQASHLTRQLLIVGRRGVIDPIVVDLNDFLGSLEDLLRRTLGENIELKLELDEGAGLVRVGLPQLEQVVVNLAMNARAAMPQGGEVTITTAGVQLGDQHAAGHIDVVPGPYTRLGFRDSGVGMTSDVAARAFEPFFTTRGPSGTGLGLSTVHAIVKQAGGHVSLESSPGRGTNISAYFPTVSATMPAHLGPAPAQPIKLGQGETLLVVEDSASLRKIVCDILRENRYRALEAADPVEALRVCEHNAGNIDLILTDVIMPRMSGRSFAEAARDLHGISRVAYMSGYDDEALANQGVLHEGIRLLQKPFLEEDLLRFIRNALDDS